MINYDNYNIDKISTWKQLHSIALKTIGFSHSGNNNLDWKGITDWNLNGKIFSRKVTLKVTDGYIRNRELSKNDKDDFHKNIIPQLYKIDSKITERFTGLIECHIRDNDLQGVHASPNNK